MTTILLILAVAALALFVLPRLFSLACGVFILLAIGAGFAFAGLFYVFGKIVDFVILAAAILFDSLSDLYDYVSYYALVAYIAVSDFVVSTGRRLRNLFA